MYSHYTYMSEEGTYDLSFDNLNNSNFVISFIVINTENYAEVKTEIEWILLGLDEERNKQASLETIAPKLAKLPFSIYAFILDKQKLMAEGGFGSKRALFAYLNKEIYDNLFNEEKDMQVQVYKEPTEFVDSFITYIEKRHQPDLFDSSSFGFLEEVDNGFMDLAKLISGVLFEKYASGKESSFLQKLSDRVVRIKLLPDFELDLEFDGKDSLDELIARYAIEQAEDYVRKFDGSQVQVDRDRVNFLKFLLTQLSIDSGRYIYSDEIINNIRRFSQDKISKEYLMREVTGPLRDAGLLLASTSKGYKIPVSKSDLLDYVKFSSSMALPMLRRIEKSRELILEVTNGKVDIIKEEEFEELKKFIDH